VARPRFANSNHLARKVLARCRKHEKLTCGGGGEELNWKSDEKNSAGSRVLQQPFEGVGYIEWK
jgi:hypothetical protein